MNYSISTTVFSAEREGCTLPQMLETIAAAGYRQIELSRHHALRGRDAVLRDCGLAVWSVHGTLDEGAASPDPAERRRAVEREVRRFEDVAALAPCPYVIHYLHRYLDPRRGEYFRESVELLHRAARQYGFILAVETAPYKPKRNERYPDSAEIAAFVRGFDAPDLRMTIDVNHSNLNEELVAVCDHCAGLIANVHISDNGGEWEDHQLPGTGVIDFKTTFAALRRNGYGGPCNFEFHLENPDAAQLRQARETMDRLLAETP